MAKPCPIDYKEVLKRTRKSLTDLIKGKSRVEAVQAVKAMHVKLSVLPTQDAADAFREVAKSIYPEAIHENAFDPRFSLNISEIPQWVADISPADFINEIDLIQKKTMSGMESEAKSEYSDDDFEKTKFAEIRIGEAGIDAFLPIFFGAIRTSVNAKTMAKVYEAIETVNKFEEFENWIIPRFDKYDQTNEWRTRALTDFYVVNRPINKVNADEKIQLVWANLNPHIDDIKEAIMKPQTRKAFQLKRAVSLNDGTKEPERLPASFLDRNDVKIFGTPMADLTMTIGVKDMVNVIGPASMEGWFSRPANVEVNAAQLHLWNQWLALEFKKGDRSAPAVIVAINSGDPGTVELSVIHPRIADMLIPRSEIKQLAESMEPYERKFLEKNSYNLFRALRNADKLMHQTTTPQERRRTVKGLKIADREKALRKLAAEMAFENYGNYFAGELEKGYIEKEHYIEFLHNAQNAPRANGALLIPMHLYLAGIVAKHEWLKGARYNQYLIHDHARGHFNRLRLANTKGIVLEGMGKSRHLVFDPTKVEIWVVGDTAAREGVSEYKVEHLRNIPGIRKIVNINDGMMLSSTDVLKRTGKFAGRNPIGKWELPVKEIKSAFYYRSPDGNNFVEMKLSEQEGIPDIEIRHARTGELIAEIRDEMDEIRIFNAKGEMLDHLSDTDVTKTLVGDFNFTKARKSHTEFELPEESRRIIHLPLTVAHTTAPLYRQYMSTMFTDKLNAQNQADMDKYNDMLTDVMLGMVDKHFNAFHDVMTDPDKLRRLLQTMWAQELDSGDPLKELYDMVGGSGIHNPAFMSQLRPMLSNMMVKKGMLQARTYEDKIHRSLQEDFAGSDGVIKTDLSGKIKEPGKHVIVSSGLASIFRLAERKYKDFYGAARLYDIGWDPKRDDEGKITEEGFTHEMKVDAINAAIRDEGFELYMNIFRTPLSHHSGMVLRKIAEFEIMQGTALKYHPDDVFWTFIGDQDIDKTFVTLVNEAFAEAALKYQNTKYFKAQQQVGADLDQFEVAEPTSLANYGETINSMANQVGAAMIGRMANMKTMSAMLSVKFGKITFMDGTVIQFKSPSEMTVMDYAPLKMTDEQGNPLREEDILKLNPSFASIHKSEDGNWYLVTTVEHEHLLIINAATDHPKLGLLTDKWGYDGTDWITARQIKVVEGQIEERHVKVITRLKSMFNLSPLFNGKGRHGKQLKVNQVFYRMRQVYDYNMSDPETQLAMIQAETNEVKKDKVSGEEKEIVFGIESIENKEKIVSLEKVVMRPVEKLMKKYEGEIVPEFSGQYTEDDYEVMHYLATDKLTKEVNGNLELFDIDSPDLIAAGSKFMSRWANKYYDLFQGRKALDGTYTEHATMARNRFDEDVNAWIQVGKKQLDELVEEHGPGVKAWTTLKFLQGIGTMSGSEFVNRKNIQNFPDPIMLDGQVMTKYMDYWEDTELNFEEYRDLNLVEEAKRTQLGNLNVFNKKKC